MESIEKYTTPWFLRFPTKWVQGKRYTLDGKTELTTGWYERHVKADETGMLHFPHDLSKEELEHMLKGLEMVNNYVVGLQMLNKQTNKENE